MVQDTEFPKISVLPSPMSFPDVIEPVTARGLQKIYQAFGVGASKKYDSSVMYERLSSRIAGWTGHEHTHDRHGRPFNREEWHESIHKSLSYVNSELALGMDGQMIDVLSLCYLALQESPRYGGDPVIEAIKGENTAVHSIHTMLQAFRIYQKTLECRTDLSKNIEFFQSFQATALMMAVHDLGEMLGEAGSLAQVANTGNWAAKDKTAYERAVFSFGVKLAIETVIDKKRTEAEFLSIIDRIRASTNIQNQGLNKSDEEMTREVSVFMQEPIQLSSRGRKLFDFISNLWESVENPAHSAMPFFGYLAAVSERVQGTRHLNRMMVTSTCPVLTEDGRVEYIGTSRLTPGTRLLTNSDYSESHLGKMCAVIDANSSYQADLALNAVAWTYETTVDFYRRGPEAFFIDPVLKESPFHMDGSAYTPDEVMCRLREISVANRIAGLEADARKKMDDGNVTAFNKDFSQAALYFGTRAVRRDDVIELYQRAIDNQYMPGMVGSRGEVLIRDLPVSLTGSNFAQSVSLPQGAEKKIAGEIKKLVAHPEPKP